MSSAPSRSLNARDVEREELEVDLLLGGAGPANLACAIHARRLLVERGMDEKTVLVLEKAEEIGKSRGVSTAAVSLGWLLSRAAVTAPIIGANSVEQLRESLQAGDLVLSPEEVAELDRVSAPV